MAENKPETPKAAPESAAKSGGLKAWLPLLIAVVTMPALALGTMQFLVLPQLKKAGHPAEETAEAETPAEASGHAAETPKKEGGHGGGGPVSKKAKQTVTLNKMIVNVAGTMGTRFLMASVTVVGSSSNFKNVIEENRDQLMDLATSTLGSKTIADLEKPGARNQIKIELMSVFNNALGESVVKEIYIPEMAIQ